MLSPRIEKGFGLSRVSKDSVDIYYDPLTWWIQTPNWESPAVSGH